MEINNYIIMTQRRIYQNIYPYFITTNAKKRIWFFEDQRIAKIISDSIINSCKINYYNLYAYCIMPNHIHILVKSIYNPTTERASLPAMLRKVRQAGVPAMKSRNISSLMHSIKSFSAKKIRDECNIEFKFWQNRFNYRIAYSKQDLQNKIYYIKNNPIKSGLEDKYKQFPYLFINYS